MQMFKDDLSGEIPSLLRTVIFGFISFGEYTIFEMDKNVFLYILYPAQHKPNCLRRNCMELFCEKNDPTVFLFQYSFVPHF